LKVPRQFPFVLLVEVLLRQGKGLGSEVGKELGCGHRYAQRREFELGFTAYDCNFNINIGSGAACEACSATRKLGTNLVFALGSRKTTENLDRVGRWEDLPDAN
jgi:hypothetical protein